MQQQQKRGADRAHPPSGGCGCCAPSASKSLTVLCEIASPLRGETAAQIVCGVGGGEAAGLRAEALVERMRQG